MVSSFIYLQAEERIYNQLKVFVINTNKEFDFIYLNVSFVSTESWKYYEQNYSDPSCLIQNNFVKKIDWLNTDVFFNLTIGNFLCPLSLYRITLGVDDDLTYIFFNSSE